ncbi:hypothetical protein RclHR1_19260002 [Rhizophagus clarus]|uniref:Uncharacterized protein n=1 Tax=Rhizophagus clarus TaxID=94130 RepID=A0A2Z6RHE5_9GLOM|nr:hypothetical protein RclHR1_19260002 [Rhizophagus clarus]
MTQNLRVTLINPGSIVPELHYGPYSFYWWIISNENKTLFPIRLGQQTKVLLNEVDFVLTIQTGSGSNKLMPIYCCQSGLHVVTESSPTKAISTVYKDCFNTSTRYSGYQVMGWNDKNILETLKKNIQYIPVSINVENCRVFIYGIGTSSRKKWGYAGSGFQSSLLHSYERKQSIYVSRIEEKKCIVEIYRESTLIKQFIGATPDEVWKKTGQLKKFTGAKLFGLDNPITKNLIQQYQIPKCTLNDWNNEYILEQLFDYYVKRRTLANANWKYFFTNWAESKNPIIEFEPALHAIYPKGYEFSERELSAWQTMLKAVGATNITPWTHEESQRQLWTKSPNGEADKVAFATLYRSGFLTSTPKSISNTTHTFWMCFERALANNKKTPNGKRRILSIISNEFTYDELKQNLNVGSHTIAESRKYARINGYGAPPLVKPIIRRQRFTPEMLEQIDTFLNDKEFVNMSSYKTDAKTGKPIKYLQDTKKALWERFTEEYPNGMHRTSFMTCLKGGQYVYRENLGGLCSTCNDCGYMVFGDIGVIISAHVTDESLKKHLLTKSQELRRYIRREYPKELEVTATGTAVHNSCISHCIRHAFGDCNLNHPVTCSKCESLFSFFQELKAVTSEEYFEVLDEYQQKLIAWMAHHARKTYLNIHVRTNLEELDGEGAVMIVDYKMRILPQSSRETKTEFFGKRGWSFHSVLVYTKNMEQNQLDIQIFDHWSNDTYQDAWFITSSFHTIIETMNPKPKWITIMSDNGMHYHCSELMLIIGH